MKSNSLSKQWQRLHWFWKLIYLLIFLSMPWTILFIIAGFWHIDNRIEEVNEKVNFIPNQTMSGIDTIQKYSNYLDN